MFNTPLSKLYIASMVSSLNSRGTTLMEKDHDSSAASWVCGRLLISLCVRWHPVYLQSRRGADPRPTVSVWLKINFHVFRSTYLQYRRLVQLRSTSWFFPQAKETPVFCLPMSSQQSPSALLVATKTVIRCKLDRKLRIYGSQGPRMVRSFVGQTILILQNLVIYAPQCLNDNNTSVIVLIKTYP